MERLSAPTLCLYRFTYSTAGSGANPDEIKIRRLKLGWFIVIVVIFLALAPLWHFAPSKTQRKQARLRERAALDGLFVELRDLPVPPAQLQRMAPVDRQVVYYGCRLRPSRAAPEKRCAWYREASDWLSRPPRQALPEIAGKMPESVLAIDLGPTSCGLYWREDGDEDLVRDLARELTEWRDELTPARV